MTLDNAATPTLPAAAQAPATAVRPTDADEDLTYHVRLCATADDLLEAHKIRCQVFHVEQGFPLETEIDEYDPFSAHFLATATSKSTGESTAVGTIRWVPYPFPSTSQSTFKPGADPTLPIGPVRDEQTVAAGFANNHNHKQSSADGDATAGAETQPLLLPGGKLTRLAVLSSARGKRLGELLVRESEHWVQRAVSSSSSSSTSASSSSGSTGTGLRSTKLVVSSQLPVIGFYTRLGYLPVGDQYDEEGAPHQRLEKIVVF